MGAGIAAQGEPVSGPFASRFGSSHIDAAGLLGLVDDQQYLVEQHLDVADAGGEALPGTVGKLDACLADLDILNSASR